MTTLYPKTVILSITTHGEILLNTPVTDPTKIIFVNGLAANIPTFNVDSRIKEFYKFNAVAPGVINYVEGDGEIDVYDIERARDLEDLFNESGNVTKINSGIRQFIVNNNVDKKRLIDSAEEIGDIVKEVASNVISEKKQEEKTMKKELKGVNDSEKLEELIDIIEYLNTNDKSHLLVDCNSKGGYMVNKTYLLGKNDVSPSGGEDWSISCLNFPFLHADIFNNILIWKNSHLTKPDKIPIKGADRGSVTLKDITDYLADQGVTRLIIVDLTCSPFAVNDEYYSGRITRRFRNDILGTKTPYGGGRENIKYICYTGKGWRNNDNRTRKQYLKVSKKQNKKYRKIARRTSKNYMKSQLAKKHIKYQKKQLLKQLNK